MKSFVVILSIFISILSSAFGTAWAHPVERRVLPTYTFPVSTAPSNLDEHTANILIQVFQKEFNSDFDGRLWQFDFQWQQPYLGAGSSYYENIFRIMLWGGMIRAEFMNLGALSALMCHELGHLLAGPPLQIISVQGDPAGAGANWASAEGTSDHYAATVCLPRIYNALLKDHPELLTKNPLEKAVDQNPALMSFIAQKCQAHRSPQACAWTIQSGIDLVEFLQVYFDREVPFADPTAKATEQPEETIRLQYPSYQCRMQIFVDGGSCADGKNCAFQRCWFAPEKDLR